METTNEAIERDVADGVQSVSADGVTVVAMDPIKRLDVADRLAQRSSSSKKHLGMAFRTLTPGGCG
jgi:hypothetical protein